MRSNSVFCLVLVIQTSWLLGINWKSGQLKMPLLVGWGPWKTRSENVLRDLCYDRIVAPSAHKIQYPSKGHSDEWNFSFVDKTHRSRALKLYIYIYIFILATACSLVALSSDTCEAPSDFAHCEIAAPPACVRANTTLLIDPICSP